MGRTAEPKLSEIPRLAASKLLTRRTLAEFLGLSVKGVQRLESSGRGPRSFRLGQLVRWRPEDVEKWLIAVAVKGGVRISEPASKAGT